MRPLKWVGRWVCDKCKKATELGGFDSEQDANEWSMRQELDHFHRQHQHETVSLTRKPA